MSSGCSFFCANNVNEIDEDILQEVGIILEKGEIECINGHLFSIDLKKLTFKWQVLIM